MAADGEMATAARVRPMVKGRLRALALLVCLVTLVPGLLAAQPEGSGPLPYLGVWNGSRLQCRKDESGPVRCGTPSPFQITFRADGTGTIQGEGFPAAFLYEPKGTDRVVIMTPDRKRKWEFFDLKLESDFISFQTYVYPESSKEAGEDYIHYIFDLAKEE